MAQQLSGISSALGALTADHKQVCCVADRVKVKWSVMETDGRAAVRHFFSARSTDSRPQAGAVRHALTAVSYRHVYLHRI